MSSGVLPPPPAGVDLDGNAGWPMRHLATAMTILTTISIVLRFWSRSLSNSRVRFWWDDWLALGVWMCCIGNCALAFYTFELGLGMHIWAAKPLANLSKLRKLLYISQLVFDSGVSLAKMSVLAFYARVFGAQPRAAFAIRITLAVVLTFSFVNILPHTFLCVPIRKYWESEVEGYCSNIFQSSSTLVPALLLDVISDLMILVLPMPFLAGLKVPRKRKSLIFAAFLCGYLTWVTSIGRFASYTHIRVTNELDDIDFTWYLIPELSWALGEISTSAISICVPSWFLLVGSVLRSGSGTLLPRKVRRLGVGRIVGLQHSQRRARLGSDGAAAGPRNSYPAPVYAGRDDVHSETYASGGPAMPSRLSVSNAERELGFVGMTREVFVLRELVSDSTSSSGNVSGGGLAQEQRSSGGNGGGSGSRTTTNASLSGV